MNLSALLSYAVIALSCFLVYVCFEFLHQAHRIGTMQRKHRLSVAGTFVMMAGVPTVVLTRIGWVLYADVKTAGILTSPLPDLVLATGASWLVMLAGITAWVLGAVLRMRQQGGPLSPEL